MKISRIKLRKNCIQFENERDKKSSNYLITILQIKKSINIDSSTRNYNKIKRFSNALRYFVLILRRLWCSIIYYVYVHSIHTYTIIRKYGSRVAKKEFH